MPVFEEPQRRGVAAIISIGAQGFVDLLSQGLGARDDAFGQERVQHRCTRQPESQVSLYHLLVLTEERIYIVLTVNVAR